MFQGNVLTVGVLLVGGDEDDVLTSGNYSMVTRATCVMTNIGLGHINFCRKYSLFFSFHDCAPDQ